MVRSKGSAVSILGTSFHALPDVTHSTSSLEERDSDPGGEKEEGRGVHRGRESDRWLGCLLTSPFSQQVGMMGNQQQLWVGCALKTVLTPAADQYALCDFLHSFWLLFGGVGGGNLGAFGLFLFCFDFGPTEQRI